MTLDNHERFRSIHRITRLALSVIWENKDYYAFGRLVLAAADGIVTDVITGVRNNSADSMKPVFADGNAVVLMYREHGT